MYYQPPSILNFYSFITSSCSLSPTVMLGTPFPFPCPSIVNTFLRRTAFSPNKEIFTMRPHKLTRCIFKTNLSNKCRICNNANVDIHTPNKGNTFQGNESTLRKKRLRYACVTIQLIPRRGEGKFAWSVTGDRKFGISFNIFADSATVGHTTYDLQVSSQRRQIRLLASWYTSVRLHYQRGFHCSTLRVIGY